MPEKRALSDEKQQRFPPKEYYFTVDGSMKILFLVCNLLCRILSETKCSGEVAENSGGQL